MFETWKWQSRLDSVETLLKTERELLLSGDARRLEQLSRRRERAEAVLDGLPEDVLSQFQDQLVRIRRLAGRNATLLRAYLDGAQQGIQRLAEIEAAQRDLGAYGRDGSRIAPLATTSSCHRRA
ncbi:MAG: hypothetical protein AAF503_11640 [Pseudomonadota bacterium]